MCYNLQPLDPTPPKGNPGTAAVLTRTLSGRDTMIPTTDVHNYVVVDAGATVGVFED